MNFKQAFMTGLGIGTGLAIFVLGAQLLLSILAASLWAVF